MAEPSVQVEDFSELVYDADARPFIEQTWPQATFDDASDFIHEGRFSVTIPGITADDFYPAMINEGWVRSCFKFELSMRLPEHHDAVLRWIDTAKALHAASQPEQTYASVTEIPQNAQSREQSS